MRRYTNWTVVLISGLLAVAAVTSTYWVPKVQPSLIDTSSDTDKFSCADYINGDQCNTLRETYKTNPELALAQQAALDPDAEKEVANEDTLSEIAESMMEGTSDTPTTTKIKSGTFNSFDAVRGAEGNATIYEIATVDGTLVKRILRFENAFDRTFRIINGPDLYVYLSQSQNPLTIDQMNEGTLGAVEISIIKGNIGEQNYELPSDLDVTQYNSVVIYSKQYNLLYSVAPIVGVAN
ncbi:MAG: DM13 domain-containing protein [Chloroflexi bacterium]|nr:DM13 domain-containing protein [Chloroflexota bacterium]